ncbi:MAG TPA: hypothetical protein VF069_10125 [Streptosporangiaceae bacterium]
MWEIVAAVMFGCGVLPAAPVRPAAAAADVRLVTSIAITARRLPGGDELVGYAVTVRAVGGVAHGTSVEASIGPPAVWIAASGGCRVDGRGARVRCAPGDVPDRTRLWFTARIPAPAATDAAPPAPAAIVVVTGGSNVPVGSVTTPPGTPPGGGVPPRLPTPSPVRTPSPDAPSWSTASPPAAWPSGAPVPPAPEGPSPDAVPPAGWPPRSAPRSEPFPPASIPASRPGHRAGTGRQGGQTAPWSPAAPAPEPPSDPVASGGPPADPGPGPALSQPPPAAPPWAQPPAPDLPPAAPDPRPPDVRPPDVGPRDLSLQLPSVGPPPSRQGPVPQVSADPNTVDPPQMSIVQADPVAGSRRAWVTVLGVTIVFEAAILWLAACFSLWRRRMAPAEVEVVSGVSPGRLRSARRALAARAARLTRALAARRRQSF